MFVRSLFWRLTLPILGLLLLIGTMYTMYWSEQFEAQAEQQFKQTKIQVVKTVADALIAPLWEYDIQAGQDVLGSLSSWSDFRAAAVIDRTGIVVQLGQPQLIDEVADISRTAGNEVQVFKSDRDLIVLLTPIIRDGEGQIGHLVTAFSAEALSHAAQSTARDAVLGLGAAFIVLAVLLTTVALSVTRPLRMVTRVIEQVADGDIEATLPRSKRGDEVGRLTRAVGVFRANSVDLISARADAASAQRIAEMALTDELTGLRNRRALSERLAELSTDPGVRDTCEIQILQMDLDGFKQINDTFGHAAGDTVLRSVAGRLSNAAQKVDMIARIGGDEFVVILVEYSLEAAVELAETLIIEVNRPIIVETQQVQVGCSIGVATAATKAPLDEALANADIALYRAKQGGKNIATPFTASLRAEVMERKKTSDQMSAGLVRGEFVPFFQPIVDAETYKITGVEVLVRWNHPDGLRQPDQFLDIAEDLGLLGAVDAQVFNAAYELFKSWAETGVDLPRLSINVSPDRLFDVSFQDSLIDAQESGVAIDLELLESFLLEDASDHIMWNIDKLRDLGCRVHVDDFGTGHSSIAGLMRVLPDKLKIDRRFVAPALSHQRERDLCKMIIEIARLMEISVVAEGVETIEHANLMRDLGCRHLQGWAFGKPMSAEDLQKILAQRLVELMANCA